MKELPINTVKRSPQGTEVAILCDQPNKYRWCIVDAWGPTSFPGVMWLSDAEVADWKVVDVPE